MAENDEPLDDLRAAAMTAAAAAARVVETIARDQQNRHAQAVDDDARRARAQAALATVQPASAVTYDTSERTRVAPEDVRHDQAVTQEPQPQTMAQMLKVEPVAAAATPPVVETTLADLAQERAEQLADARARQLVRLAATDWLKETDPDAAKQYLTERRKGGLSNAALDKLDGDVIRDWKAATGQEADPTPTAEPVTSATPSYDSAQRRSAADEAMRAGGVPDEARHARVVSDRMNGTDPALAVPGQDVGDTQRGWLT